jgi:hypothetical protein
MTDPGRTSKATRQAGDRGDRERSEIATVKQPCRVRIHQKDLAVTDHATALPDRQRASAVVLFVGDADRASVDRKEGPARQTVCPYSARTGLSRRSSGVLREPSGEHPRFDHACRLPSISQF